MKAVPPALSMESRANDPFFWLTQARKLDRAAMLIWAAASADFLSTRQLPVGAGVQVLELGGVFWLNAGFALENLLKGLIVKNDPSSVQNGRITRRLKTHNLLRLAKSASVQLTKPDAYFMWVATESVIWAGRYPCATDPKRAGPLLFSEADKSAYRSLFDRWSSRFDTLDPRRMIWQQYRRL